MEDLERIVDLDNEVIATLMESILNEREIPHIIRTYHDSAYDGLWAFQQGWGFIEASPEHKDEILEIFDDLIKQQGQ
jgi:hypothetical protein